MLQDGDVSRLTRCEFKWKVAVQIVQLLISVVFMNRLLVWLAFNIVAVLIAFRKHANNVRVCPFKSARLVQGRNYIVSQLNSKYAPYLVVYGRPFSIVFIAATYYFFLFVFSLMLKRDFSPPLNYVLVDVLFIIEI